MPAAGVACGLFAALYLATTRADEPLRGMLFLAALAVGLVPLAAGCRWLAVVRQSLARAEQALADSRSAYRDAAEYLLAERPVRTAGLLQPAAVEGHRADEAGDPSAVEAFVDHLPVVTAAMIDALLHRDYPALAGRADALRAAGERLGWRPLVDAAAAVADGATAADGPTATMAMMILVSTCQVIARDRAVTA